MVELAKEFMQLFRGLERAYLRAEIAKPTGKAGEKVKSKVFTVHEEPTEDVWASHLEGKDNLGIIPINDKSKSYFGAIDIDNYTLDFKELEKRIDDNELPLVICRSKSGGAHLYLFLTGPVATKTVVSKLRMFGAVLGYAHEIFPKQTKLASKNDTGNGISMPYFGGEKTNRFAYHTGAKLSPEEFIEFAKSRRISGKDLTGLNIKIEGDFKEAPPCLQVLSQTGIPKGDRNKGMFSFAVFCKKKYGDHWQGEFEKVNMQVCSPMLPATEILKIQHSISRADKSYFYQCQAAPLVGHCDKERCRTIEHGIGTQDEIPITITSLSKMTTDPPIYTMQIDGQRIDLTSDQLLNYNHFRKKVFEYLDVLLPRLGAKQWDGEIKNLMASLEVREAPEAISPTGKMLEYLEAYCTGTQAKDNKEVLLRGGVWVDSEHTYVRQRFFEEYLHRMKFMELPSNKITAIFKNKLHAVGKKVYVLGRCNSCWRIDSFTEQKEDFNVPTVEEDM